MISGMTKERTKELAERIIMLAQKRIALDTPSLLMAVYALQLKEKENDEPISTDGVCLWYHPERVLRDFQKNNSSVMEQILHVTLHCLLGHLKERDFYGDKRLYDMIADCKVAEFASHICKNIGQHWQWGVPSAMYYKGEYTKQIYDGFSAHKNARRDFLKEKKKVALDDHDLWKKSEEFFSGCGAQEGLGSMTDSSPDWKGIQETFCAKAKKNGSWGDIAGSFAGEFVMAEENGISYDTFLRRFAKNREQMKTDPDSIDFKWYHVGMEQYGNIPLLEPTECNDMPACDQFVIAIDTSGSCKGEVCSRFLRETLNLLQDISSYGDKMNVTLLQCDAMIQGELQITSGDQIETALKEFQPKGFGGTDFRPVFDWADDFQNNGGNVQALLYLSDGAGDFPEQEPDYPVAFLLYDTDDWAIQQMPKWITRLKLDINRFTVEEATI